MAIDRIATSQDFFGNTGFVIAIILAFSVIHALIWGTTRYLVGLVFRLFAPFAYVVNQIEASLRQLLENRSRLFQDPQSFSEKWITRYEIIEKIGRAGHVLDVSLRRARASKSPTSRKNERLARRKVAAYLAKAEELLWDKGITGRIQAIEILQVAAYQTLLRSWTLHQFKDVTVPDPSSTWSRRWPTIAKEALTIGATIAPLVWQVFAPEDLTPGHWIREYLYSRTWWP
ncbi:hypothetical protein [Arthrobacter sp. B3I9]|uniref:hypothetical protein n=1 Tax=Arthrobacter sp. B3I9 TaxID=3042270 RepID=UPI0027D7E06D|nr:hypothetical protein [Arthrobacter sp. B3I9]